ncbi:MAG TPA: SMC family ATPase [Gemmatimonadales bacterium]|nr:SMC family ATPase [Gemmatimonadales bacterium]
MQITRLHLVNFRQHEDTDLDFGPGLTGIIGPNGAGKTTILEAIAWAMYGTPAARGNRESIRRRGAPPRARVEVELEFILGPRRYRVVRSLHGAELYQDSEPAPIANSIAAVTDRITRLLGMTRDEFFNTYFTGQKELAVMAAMSAPERAQFLSRVLGYERIRSAQDRLRDRRSGLRARLDGLQSSLPDPARLDAEEAAAQARLVSAGEAEAAAAQALAAADAELAQLLPRRDALETQREAAAALDGELRVAVLEARTAAERATELERQQAEAAAALERLAPMRRQLEPLEALRAEQHELDQRAEAVQQRRSQMSRLEVTRAQLAALEERIARLPSTEVLNAARERVRAIRADLTVTSVQAEERRTAWVRDTQDATTKRQGLLEQYHDLKTQRQVITEAGPDGACPTCARPLGAEYEKVMGVLDRQLEEVLSNGQYYKQRLDQLKEEPDEVTALDKRRVEQEREAADAWAHQCQLEAQAAEAPGLERERDQLRKAIAELERAVGSAAAAYDQARHELVRREVRALEPLALQAERLAVLAERAEPLGRELAAARQAAADLDARVTALKAQVAALNFAEPDLLAARRAVEGAEAARRKAEIAQVAARSDRSSAEEAGRTVQQRRAERAALLAQIQTADTELKLAQELDRALADLRTDLNQTLRPELSEIASGFIRDLTNARYTDLELDENYVPLLLDDGDPKTVISGGEEDVANLALRLAISQMIAERAGQPLSLLVLDEIFGSLDEERRAAVVELLRSLAGRFPQVILITHIDAVREGFDRIIRVGLDRGRGVSVVSEEPLGGQDAAA